MKTLRLLCLLIAAAAPALAQYRPPPATESERLTRQGDELRSEAAQAVSAGKKEEGAVALKKAVEHYQQALTEDPSNANAAAGLGAAGVGLGDYELVIRTLTPINAKAPDNLDVALQLGVAHYKKRSTAIAVPLLEKVSAGNKPEHLISHYLLAQFYLQQQRGDAAVAEAVKYLKLRPTQLAANDFEIHLQLGKGFLLWKKPKEARESFERAQRGRPDLTGAQLGLSEVLEAEGKANEAVALLEGLIARKPTEAEPKERLARLYMAQGNLTRAEALAADYLKIKASERAHLLMGEVKLSQKQAKAAESELKKALEALPNWPPAQIALAKSYQMQSRNDEAIGLLEAAVNAGVGGVDILGALGSTLRRAGRFQKAVETHQKVLATAPTLPLGNVLLGADYYATGEWDKAIDQYTLALEKDPKNGHIKHWLALALSQRGRVRAEAGRFDDSWRDLRRAFDLERTAEVGRNLGAVLLTQRSYKDAKAALTQVVAMPQASWKDSLLLGYAQLGEGDATSALETFEKAAKLTTEGSALGEIYVGWSMAKVELGDYDTAISKLMDPSLASSASKLTQANLPLAMLRRALDKLKTGDVANARKDLEAVEKLSTTKSAEVAQLSQYAKALVDAEEGRYDEAAGVLRETFAAKPKWANAQSKSLVDAYLEYRRGRMPQARKLVAAAKRAEPAQAAWAEELSKAIERRDAERSYAAGNMGAAEKALRTAKSMDPLNVYVAHNWAALQYRKGKTADAVKSWEDMLSTLPEAALNLGIDAQVRQKNPKRAVDFYAQYEQAGGTKMSLAREWKDRLSSLYGLSAAQEEAAEQSEPTNSAAATTPSGGSR